MARRTHRLGAEFAALESRSLPSAGLTATLTAQGVFKIRGTAGADQIVVRDVQGVITVADTSIRVGGQMQNSVNAGAVSTVVIHSRAGDDEIFLGLGDQAVQAPCQINAGGGDDWVSGGRGSDTIRGGAGDDVIFGHGGLDLLYGGAGNDFLDDGDRNAAEVCKGGRGLDWNADFVAVNGTGFDDIHQRGSPSCSFLATLSGLALRGTDFTQWIEYRGMNQRGMPEYAVAFWTGSQWHWQPVEFAGWRTELDTAPAVDGESWAILMNRAWMAYHGDNGSCLPHEAMFALTGRQAAYGWFTNHMMGSGALNAIVQTLNNQGVVVAGTGTPQMLSTDAVVNNDAYLVLDVIQQDGTVWMLMRNPWGSDGGQTTCGNPNDGIVWINWQDFQQSMMYLAVL